MQCKIAGLCGRLSSILWKAVRVWCNPDESFPQKQHGRKKIYQAALLTLAIRAAVTRCAMGITRKAVMAAIGQAMK